MGKVYEALKRAEREESSRPVTAAPLQGGLTRSAVERREPADQFDFVDYSLTALPSEEVAQRNHEAASAAFARHSLVNPAREVTLDMARIDPHLTTFFDYSVDTCLVASEQYTKMAISMISQKEERRLKRILIASTHRAEGRTCVTLNLACALARARQRVLIIDADLHRPSLHRFLGIEADAGLADVVRGNLPPGKASIKVLPFGFEVLPTREQVENAAGLLSSARFREMLEMLEAEYDFILLDSSPLLRVNDANLLVRLTDATIFVIRAGKTSSMQLGKAVGSLTQDHLFGVVLNRAEAWANGLNG
jgi:protein-tyrosine kinase